MQLVSDDLVNEALESDHLALQNMSGSKYVQVRAISDCPCMPGFVQLPQTSHCMTLRMDWSSCAERLCRISLECKTAKILLSILYACGH